MKTDMLVWGPIVIEIGTHIWLSGLPGGQVKREIDLFQDFFIRGRGSAAPQV